jgi:hypothetical protein
MTEYRASTRGHAFGDIDIYLFDQLQRASRRLQPAAPGAIIHSPGENTEAYRLMLVD